MEKRFKLHASKIMIYIVVLSVAVAMTIPFAWMLSSSFKYNTEIFSYPTKWIPETFRWDNYLTVWTQIPFPIYFFNSLKLSVTVTIGQLLVCSMAAYSFSKLHYPGRDKLFLIYLGTMMVPWQAIMIPQFMVVRKLGLYNTHWSLIVINLFSAFGVFVLRQFMLGIPEELSEAAKIDGCSEMKIFTGIIMPLCKPGLATLTVFTFNYMWNDYLAPMIYLDNDKLKTIQLGLASFRTTYKTEYGLLMAGSVCALLPILIIFCSAQKYLVEGVAHSGLKG